MLTVEPSITRQNSSFLHVVQTTSRRPSNSSMSTSSRHRPSGVFNLGDFTPRQRNRSRSASIFSENSDSGSRREIATMSNEEKQKMQDLFNTFDKQHSGSIDVNELVPLLTAMGHHMSQDQAMDLLSQVDMNMNGKLEFSEFMQLVTIFKNVAQFRLYDKEETDRHTNDASKFTISTNNMFLWLLDGAMILVLTYIVSTVLFIYGFNDVNEISRQLSKFDEADIVVTFFLAAQLVTRFFVAVPRKLNAMVTDQEHLVLSSIEYATTFFIFDLVSILPLRLFTNDPWTEVVLAHGRLFAAARWLETLSPPRVQVISRSYVEFFYLVAPGVKHACEFFLLVHFIAVLSLRIMSDQIGNYSAAYYQAMYIIAGVGYGDFHPSTGGQQVFLAFACVVAILTNAVVVGSVVEFLASSDVDGTRKNRLAETQAVLSFFDVPVPLQEEILQFQDHVMNKDIQKAYGHLTGHLPREIKAGLTLQFRINLLSAVATFAAAHSTTQIMLAQKLRADVFRPEEYIVLAGEPGDAMYFTNYGFVDHFTRDGTYIETTGVNKCFGDEAILEPFTKIMRVERHRDLQRGGDGFSLTPSQEYIESLQRAVGRYSRSTKTITYVEAMTLTALDFTEVMMQFPRFRAEVERDATSRYHLDSRNPSIHAPPPPTAPKTQCILTASDVPMVQIEHESSTDSLADLSNPNTCIETTFAIPELTPGATSATSDNDKSTEIERLEERMYNELQELNRLLMQM